MANIVPFKAVKPSKDKAAHVVTRSYESYSDYERNVLLEFNPFSFLHIVNPGYKFHQHITGEQRFSSVRNRYDEFKEENIFLTDETAGFYLYKMQTRSNTFCGLIAGASVKDYKKKVIKKHEKTLEKREELFKNYLKGVGFNAEPVLLTYKDNDSLNALLNAVMATVPEYSFTTLDRVHHELWTIADENIISKIQDAFKGIDAMYIADGHHRSASSYRLAKDLKSENPEHTGDEAYNYFMSYLIPESQLKIYEFNRIVKDLNGLSKEEFLIRLDQWYRIENRGSELYKPTKKHHFSMYLDGAFYSLYLRKNLYDFSDARSELDVQILYKTILEPILGVKNLRNNTRIEYGYGKHNIIKMKDLIDSKEFAVGFGLVPISVEELKKVSDEDLKMPPKSTYIEPKLRSGLLIYEF